MRACRFGDLGKMLDALAAQSEALRAALPRQTPHRQAPATVPDNFPAVFPPDATPVGATPVYHGPRGGGGRGGTFV